MTETYLTSEQAKDFLVKHPTVQWIDIFMHDLNGIPRGKRIRSRDLLGFARQTDGRPPAMAGGDQIRHAARFLSTNWRMPPER